MNWHSFTYIDIVVNGLAWLPPFEDGCKCLMTLLAKQFIFFSAAGAIDSTICILVPFVSSADSAGNSSGGKALVTKYFLFVIFLSLALRNCFWKKEI